MEPCVKREDCGNSLDALLRERTGTAGRGREPRQQGPGLLRLAWPPRSAGDALAAHAVCGMPPAKPGNLLRQQ